MSVVIELLASSPYFDTILAIALGICIGGIMHSLSSYIGKIPWVGGPIANAVDGMAQVITNAVGHVIAPISDAVGGTLHQIARLVDWTYGEFRRHASLLLGIAAFLPALALAIEGIRALVHRLTTTHDATAAKVKTLEREYHGIEHQIKQLEREFHGIDETGIRQKLNQLDRRIEQVQHDTIPALRDRVAADEGAFTGLESWLGIKSGVDYKTWTIALATTLLGAVGLGNLRCSNFTRLLGKYTCGLGTLLDDLLGLAIAGIALEAVCDFLPLVEDAFGLIIGPMVHILNEVPLGGCETPPAGWAQFNVTPGPRPPQQTLGTFPG